MQNIRFKFLIVLVLSCCAITTVYAQSITGVWRGKINNQRVELKIVQKGDSIVGTSYYMGLSGSRRYSIKGYFDPNSNSVVWWDEELISGKNNINGLGFQSVADFNCPGGSRMFLDGKSARKEEQNKPTGEVALTKVNNPTNHDEWDFILDNYFVGANNPGLIDSVSRIAFTKAPIIPKETAPIITLPPVAIAKPAPKPVKQTPPVVSTPVPPKVIEKTKPEPAIVKKAEPEMPPTIDEMFDRRKKVFTQEIVLLGDSITLDFYDNAEVDGDSITLFLNNKMIFTHVRLTASPFQVKLGVNDLQANNELVMVAENLGSIPPNTALMIAMVAGKRHEAYMESTEESSCLIRFKKAN